MSTAQSKSLIERRAELEKQLRSLTDRTGEEYFPGMTIIPGHPRAIDEQTALQIEELQAAIAEIDESLKRA
jgi:transposase